MTKYLRIYEDGEAVMFDNKPGCWGSIADTMDFLVDTNTGTVTRAERIKNGWVKEGTADVYYDYGNMLGFFEPAVITKYAGSYFVCISSTGMSFFACETDTDNLKQLIERTAR